MESWNPLFPLDLLVRRQFVECIVAPSSEWRYFLYDHIVRGAVCGAVGSYKDDVISEGRRGSRKEEEKEEN